MNQTKSFLYLSNRYGKPETGKANQGGAGVDHQTLADFERI